MKRILLLSLLMSAPLGAMAAPQQLANYLGTGSDPKLVLELSEENGPGWDSFTIDYKGIGGIPYHSTTSKNWSPWNVKDECGNYYGTITLHSNGSTATLGGYEGGENGFYLEGIEFVYNATVKAYQLTVDKINRGEETCQSDAGPFPYAPLAQPAVYADTQAKITFSVNGDKMVNDRGEEIILKGIVRPSLEWNAQGEFLSEEDIKNMVAWEANMLRINMNQNYWFQSAPATEKGSYKQIINALVYYAIENNMAVVLDLHWTDGQHQSNMANKESVRFWKEVAYDYKDFGTVIFELFNEPVNIDKNIWLNGNEQYAGYQELFDAVREVGANNICLINGLDWGYDLSFVNESYKVNGSNIIYGSHPYNEKGKESYTGQGGSFDNNFKGVLGTYPLMFTEFGVNDPSYFPNGYQGVYEHILAYINQHDISYSAFAWWVESDPARANVFPSVIKDWNGSPLNGGVYINDDMHAEPGTPIE